MKQGAGSAWSMEHGRKSVSFPTYPLRHALCAMPTMIIIFLIHDCNLQLGEASYRIGR